MTYRLFFIIIIQSFFLFNAFALEKYKPVNFRHFTSADGFYNYKINCMLQDNDGFIWIGTNEGIYIYKGWKFEQIKNISGNVKKITNGIIQQLYKDKDGNIWIAANTGIAVYHSSSRLIVHAETPVSDNYFISGIEQSDDGLIWAGTNKGMFSFKSTGIAHAIFRNPVESYRLTYLSGKIYLINPTTIYSVDKKTGLIQDSVGLITNGNIADNTNISLATDRNGNIYIGKYNGCIYKFNTHKKSVTIIDLKKKTGNNSAIINHLCYDSTENKIWIAVDECGIYKLNPSDNSLDPYLSTLNKSTNLPTLKISYLLIDRERNVWLSMEKNGLAMTNALLNSFNIIDPLQHTSTSIVSAVLKDTQGNLWIGTDGGGLLKYNSTGNLIYKFRNEPANKNSLSNDAVLALTEDSRGQIWIGTFRGGLSLYHPKSNTFTNYLADVNNVNGLQRNDVRKIVEDKNGNLWLVVHGQGVTLFNPTTIKFSNYTHIKDEWTLDLISDHAGIIWLASNSGLSKLDKNSLSFTTIKSVPSDLIIQTLYQDKEGTLWIGSVKGLYFLDQKNEKLQQLPHENILNKTSIQSIEETADGSLVIGTRRGLVLYNLNQKKLFYFTEGTGLPADEFVINSSYNYNDSIIYLGNSKGLCSFNPAKIKKRQMAGMPVITAVTVFNEPKEKIISIPVFLKNISTTNLKYNENNISISFAYPWYTQSSSGYFFQYKLVGIDKTWKSTTEPEAVYSSLPSGEFSFTMRVVSKSSSQEFSPETTIHVIVLPPFWETIWFRVLILMPTIAILVFIYKKKTDRILRKNKELEAKVNERTKAILQHKNLLEQQRAELEQANKSKDKLFSVIAHDLRSPFSSILSVTSLFQNNNHQLTEDDKSNMVNMLRTSSENAFQLLENLLEWAKSQTQTIRYNPEKVSLKDLCKNVIAGFHKTAEEKEIKLRLIANAEIVAITDKHMLQTIIRNLISNAIKFTNSGGKIEIYIRHSLNDSFTIEIKDSGKGISAEDISQILSKSGSLKPGKGSDGEFGTGLGLWICKEFLPYLNGKMDIKSDPGNGSSFIINISTEFEVIPIINSNDGTQEKILSNISFINPTKVVAEKHPGKILIVEDQLELLQSLGIFLNDHYEILLAENGLRAWEILQENYVDLILTDVVMPIMDGIEFCRKCKENIHTNHIPIILLTSQKNEIDIINGLQADVDDYLVKPVHSEILLLKIKHLISVREFLKKKFTLENQEILNSMKDNSPEKAFMEMLLKLTDEHLHEESFGVEELSKLIGMHRSSLSKKLVAISEITPNELIKIQRLKKAARLMLSGGFSVSQIAYQVGFSDPKYFSRSFKAYFGSLPTEYRQMKNEKIKIG